MAMCAWLARPVRFRPPCRGLRFGTLRLAVASSGFPSTPMIPARVGQPARVRCLGGGSASSTVAFVARVRWLVSPQPHGESVPPPLPGNRRRPGSHRGVRGTEPRRAGSGRRASRKEKGDPARVVREPGRLSLVEVAGIEPASSVASSGLLRVQLAVSLLGPTSLTSKPV